MQMRKVLKVKTMLVNIDKTSCVKSVRIRSYSGPHFLAFELNTVRQGVSLRIQTKCGRMWTRITPNRDTFYAVNVATIFPFVLKVIVKLEIETYVLQALQIIFSRI